MSVEDEARVIPLHAGALSGPARRARLLARRPLPRPAGRDADILALPAQPEPGKALEPAAAAVPPQRWEHRVEAALDFLIRRLQGGYRVDEYGFDADLTENVVLPIFRPLYEKWFRVEVNGVDNVPAEGGALLVANHAGGLWALDAAMTAVAVHVEHPAGRYLRPLGADLLFGLPGVGSFARKTGSTLACSEDAERLLAAGELVGVWPEGFKGIGKPFRERYKLQRFGRGGFVHAAIKSGVPIIPVSIVGSEEIHPVLGNAKVLARLFDLPYFPVTPTFPWLGPLGLVPLPSKWYIEFGTPIHTEAFAAEAAEDPATVFDLADRVRETIQSTLYRLLIQRRSIWR
jgi:1-acyl-sn-glycerol-3-phosphate acyltransferase